jgi:tetratricopeptide (TPR) repeat protein
MCFDRFTFVCLTVAGLSLVAKAEAPRPMSDEVWWQTERAVNESLKNDDLLELVTSPEIRKHASDPAELLRRLQLFVRAGHREDASAIIPELAESRARLSKRLLEQVAMFLLGREEWMLARVFLETFPAIEAGWDYTLFRHWKEREGKSIGEIDAWLVKRQPANPAYWVKHRIRLRAQNGTDGALIAELADDIRAHPAEPGRVFVYLDATSHRQEKPEWLGEAFRPGRALDAYHVGSRLTGRAPEASVKFLERALEMELTAEEVDEAAMRIQRAMFGVEARKMVLGWFRHALVGAYQKTGRHQKAQKLMEQLVRETGDEPLSPHMAQVAGQVQGASGARAVERRIRKAETEQKDSPRYWLSRGNYYAGREEHAKAIGAYDKALTLAPVKKQARHKVPDVRFQILNSYQRHLVRMKKLEEADRLLHRELQAVPPDSITAARAVNAILSLDTDHQHMIRPADPALWRFLERRPAWDFTEERLLWKLLDRTPKAKRKQAFARAERIARGRDPTRSQILGWVLTRMDENRRAVPLLNDAVRRLKVKDDLESARFNLFEAYLDTGDWRAAEELFPLASARLTGKERPRWYARVAVVAAKKGAKADALRIWKRVSNLDPADLHRLDEMAAAGMKKELTDYYRALARRDPKSWIPGRALEILK